MNEPIRLTNKTAVAIRRSAQRVKRAYAIAALILSALLIVLGVALGAFWMPAAPIMAVAIVLMDAALMTAARSHYLMMLGQAICTEAAARDIRAGASASMRREQALAEMMRVKADAAAAHKAAGQPGAQPFFEKQEEREDEQQDAPQQPAAHRRRRSPGALQLIKGEQAK